MKEESIVKSILINLKSDYAAGSEWPTMMLANFANQCEHIEIHSLREKKGDEKAEKAEKAYKMWISMLAKIFRSSRAIKYTLVDLDGGESKLTEAEADRDIKVGLENYGTARQHDPEK